MNMGFDLCALNFVLWERQSFTETLETSTLGSVCSGNKDQKTKIKDHVRELNDDRVSRCLGIVTNNNVSARCVIVRSLLLLRAEDL